jgi:hypothetical protein
MAPQPYALDSTIDSGPALLVSRRSMYAIDLNMNQERTTASYSS